MKTLTKPDAFLNDRYGWLTNQISHIGLGVFLTFAICLVYFAVNGEMPYRTAALMLIASGYLSFELFVQGWRGHDTVEDTVFTVGYGSCAVLAAFTEVTPGSAVVALDALALLPFFIVAVLHLSAGSYARPKR